MVRVKDTRYPRRLLALFLALTVIPSALVVTLGWSLYRQERASALQQLHDRREQAADNAVVALEQILSAAEKALRDPAAYETLTATEGAVVVRSADDGLTITPAAKVAFWPEAKVGREAPADTFSDIEALEATGQFADASDRYAQRLTSADVAVRGGALFRIGRVRRQQARTEDALHTWARLLVFPDVAVGGIPVELMSRWARCDLLARAGRVAELKAEAEQLRSDLASGRWRISRTAYEANAAAAREWTGAPAAVATEGELLAVAVEQLWRRSGVRGSGSDAWSPGSDAWSPGSDVWSPGSLDPWIARTTIQIGDRTVTILQVSDETARAALVALPSFVEREWLARAATAAERQRVRITLRDPSVRGASSTEARRLAIDSNLPWTVVASDADATGELARLDARRTLWMAGFAAVTLLIVTGAYAVTRAVGRELAVARLKSDFVAAVSHEFRTPLTSLRQLTEILIDERITSDDRRRTYYRALERQTDRLHRLVESLLDFGRMEAGTSPYRLAPLDAGALVRGVVAEFSDDPASRGASVVLGDMPDELSIAGDRDALRNLLWNLLDNAVKYSPEGATVRVYVAVEGDRVLVRVRDRGHGIPASEHESIFDPFVRGSLAKSENIQGTGIGLAMVRHIARAHGGNVHVESAPGQGSTFTVSLPLVAAPAAAVAPQRAAI